VLTPPGAGLFDGRIDFTEPYGGVVVAFVVPEGANALLRARDHIAVSTELHQPIEIGAQVGIAFRAGRISIFDAETGAALPRD
jgi:hypothetical protein